MSFTFHPAIQTWFNSEFRGTSPPQKQGWPHIAAGEHTLILAPTGSGKTLAAFLWCIHDILTSQLAGEAQGNSVHTLYISPLKALNNDIHRNLQSPLSGIKKCARNMQLQPPDIRALVRTGDTPSHVRQAMVKKPPHILITTPESLYLLLTSERGREIFRDLRYVIVDEIHAISNGKRGVHLSVTVERLMPLCSSEPVRIGLSATQRPLQRIAAFLGGQVYPTLPLQDADGGQSGAVAAAATQFASARPQPRPVAIVDCGQRKNIDLKVVSPVKSFSDLPDATVWPAVIAQLYELITSHKTTLVFVNMRSQSERVARQLNEMAVKDNDGKGDEIALAHHGSMSREVRYEVEERLKAGAIPAVIATGSLELGIDIGSIDLVVQLESPRSISGGLQRVGRSGHLLDATSKGRIIPLYQSDLDDAVAFAELMLAGDIEETTVPENCLDVLAQQIVAEVALREWPREALFRLFRQSYCFRNLTETAFNQVVEMLAGRYADTPLRALQPRLNWDRINDRLLGLRGSRLLATMNGGTIPDRGYYAVFLAGSNTRLGEMEEEFVFESRVGQVFYLGNNEWRIDDIQQDRIVVSPVRSVKPRPPFWKGDLQHRQFESCRKVGAFRAAFAPAPPADANPSQEDGNETSRASDADQGAQQLPADADTLANLRAYLERQRAATAVLPTDRLLVAERFRDAADQPHLILHTCFGARVNGLWAIGLGAALEQKFGVQVQFSYGEDGLIIRTLDTPQALDIDDLFRIPVEKMEALLVGSLIDAPVFNVHFRYNAARALILPRSQPGKRIPLWLQRLRAADLLQLVRQFDDFPILAETCRDCLQDVFDWAGLKSVITALHSGEMAVHCAHTRMPSPMASGLMFNFLSENIYETDRSRLPGQVAAVSSELLAEILNKEDIPQIVNADLVGEAEARWQHLTPETQAADRETLFNVIVKLGPIAETKLSAHCQIDPAEWLDDLVAQGRIIHRHGQVESASADKSERELLRSMLRVHGPLSKSQMMSRLRFSEARLDELLVSLLREKEVVRGQLLIGEPDERWCDRHNFAELYRRAVALRRKASEPALRPQWLQFLLSWHHVAGGRTLAEVIEHYAGLPFQRYFFEREIMPTRIAQSPEAASMKEALSNLLASGAATVQAARHGEDGRLKLYFAPRATGGWFTDRATLQTKAKSLTGESKTVHDFLTENGTSLLRDIANATDLSTAQVQRALQELIESGIVTSDSYPAFLQILTGAHGGKTGGQIADWLPTPTPVWARSKVRNPARQAVRHAIREQVESGDSKWSLTTSFAIMGKPLTTYQQAERQARLLLRRYGILVKEWYRREQSLLPWYELFKVLKRLEWQGEIRRGFFIHGLSGVQFALPEAVELLTKIQSGEVSFRTPEPVMLSTCDPALPLGGQVAWQMRDLHGNSLGITRSPANHLIFWENAPVLYCENFAARIWRLSELPGAAATGCLKLIKSWLRQPVDSRPRKRIEIAQIDEGNAAQHELATELRKLGFETDGEKLTLWPSGV